MENFNKKEAKELIKRAKQNQKKIEDNFTAQRKRAAEAFKDHEIRVLVNTPEVQSFECRNKNGSWCYGFRVVCSDNLICMYGDIGELMFLPGYNRQGVKWLRGSIDSEGYFFEKLDRPYITDAREFSTENAINAIFSSLYGDDIDEILEYQQPELNMLKDLFDGDIEFEHEFYERAYYKYSIDETPRPTSSRFSLEYRYQALKKLCELLDKIDFNIQKDEAV